MGTNAVTTTKNWMLDESHWEDRKYREKFINNRVGL